MDSYFRGFLTGLILISLICANPALAAFSEEVAGVNSIFFEEEGEVSPVLENQNSSEVTNTSTNSTQNSSSDASTPNNDTSPSTGATPATTSYSCDLVALTSKEANAIIDLAGDGFLGDKITDGSDANASGTSLEGLELIGDSTDGTTAVKQEPPTQASDASRFNIFSDRDTSGPFGVGLILNDTLRVGRCIDLTQEECRIYGNGLSLRTSGKGFVSNVTDVFSSLTKKDAQEKLGLTEEEYDGTKENFLDNNSANFGTVSVEATDQIPNSFVTDRYSATQATNCTNSACLVSTYSTFDKYFNAWYSFDMVVSGFGPILLNGAKKLFASGRRDSSTLLGKINNWYDDLARKIDDLPAQAIRQDRINLFQNRLKNHGLGGVWESTTIKKSLFSSGARGDIDKLLAPDSPIMKLSPTQKQEFFKSLNDLRSFAKQSQAKISSITSSLPTGVTAGLTDAQIAALRTQQVSVARDLAKEYNYWDDVVFLDFPEWIKDSGTLSSFAEFNLKKNLTAPGAGYVNLAQEGSFNAKLVFDEFGKTGNWSNWANSVDGRTFAANADGTLKLFQRSVGGRPIASAVGPDDVARYINPTGAGDIAVKIRETGNILEINQATVDALRNGTYPGTIDIVGVDWVEKAAKLTPEDLAGILTQKRIYGRVSTANNNLDDLYYALREKPEFTAGRSFSLLDSQLQKEEQFFKNFYTQPLKTGIYAGTLKPIGYWQLKKGFGFENLSSYMLPDTWTQIEVSQGYDKIYADSYIDFYANEGSDQGDLFKRLINSPISIYNFILTKATEENSVFLSDWVTKLTGSSDGIESEGFILSTKTIMRDEVENIAFYSHNETCSGCSAGFKFDGEQLTLSVTAPSKIDAFIVEATSREIAEKKGATLIAYTHHSNLSGSDGKVPGGEINLSQARVDKTTCEDAIRKSMIGFALPKSSTAGIVIATTETLGYLVGLGPGLIVTGFMQLLITPELQDCVDDIEGYYIHFYDPPSAVASKAKPKEVISSQNITETFSNLTSSLKDSSGGENPVAGALSEISEEFQQFAEGAKRDNLLQAKIKMMPPNSGSVVGSEVFYIWYKGNMMPTGLKTEGKMVISDGNDSVEVNYEEGSLSINGEKVIDNKKEIIGLATTDTRVPATIIPAKVNKISAPNTSDIVFELTPAGEVYVRQQNVLDCVRKAIETQSGISYSGNELSSVFGNLLSINTQNYDKVFVSNSEIHLEGTSPRVKGGVGSKFLIDGFWNSRLEIDNNRNVDAGKFIGMAFDNGSIVINKETNELVIWLRHHKNAILTNNEVSGLKAKLTTTDNEEECPVPAIQLEALGFPGDALGQQKVGNFNKSMEVLGPFTQFTTDSKIYQFYSKRDETGECKDYFKVIDKETGKVIADSEIVGGIVQDEDGKLKFQTADGKSHTLDFSAENGVPKVSYNGAPAETLLTAQGPNGSFWYDPNTGKWYPENGIQIPLGQSIKDNGLYYGTDKDGQVSGSGVNPMTFNIGQQGGSGFNIPLTPTSLLMQILLIMTFLSVVFYITKGKKED